MTSKNMPLQRQRILPCSSQRRTRFSTVLVTLLVVVIASRSNSNTNNGLVSGVVSASGVYEHGVAPSHVVPLTKANFDTAIHDPANSVWFLKFFAPWCGHCKRLAPVLDSVAPQTAGRLSIGTIDCTLDKAFCDEFKIRGYPTLKFALDGVLRDYSGGRTEKDLLALAAKLNRPVVEAVTTVAEAYSHAATVADDGVVFVVYHPAATGNANDNSGVDEWLQASTVTQVFAQVARSKRAETSCVLLNLVKTTASYQTSLLVPDRVTTADSDDNDRALLCRLEANVPPRCFPLSTEQQNLDLATVSKWVDEHRVPTVSHLGAHNFHAVGRSGRPLVIAVVDESNPEQTRQAQRALAHYATEGSLRDQYYYGWFDGHQWKRFLEQFQVKPDALPQVFVLDVPRKTYYQNATYQLNVADFLEAVQEGTIEVQTAGKGGFEGVVQRVIVWMQLYHPYSTVMGVLVFALLLVGIVRCVTPPDDELRPPYPRKDTAAAAEAKKTK